MDALQLIAIHLELACIGVGEAHLLRRIDCPNPDDLPRFYIARHEAGYSRNFRHDLPTTLRERLTALDPDMALNEPESVKHILQDDAPCENVHIGKSYIFPQPIMPSAYPDVVRVRDGIFGIVVGGEVVSTCESSRENDKAGEAWVQTLPEYRGRGYAKQVTAAWAYDLQKRGKIPFYSHKLTNRASQAVARGLALKQYIADAAYV